MTLTGRKQSVWPEVDMGPAESARGKQMGQSGARDQCGCCCCEGADEPPPELDKQPAAAPEIEGQRADKESPEQREEEEEEGENENGENLDSGYAWCILVVMFLLQSSISGASRVYGIVYAKQVAVGYYDREQASWPIASASAVENLAGILTPALARFLSWRRIELLSSCLFIAANLLAYFSNSLEVDILALGLVQGLALSTSTVLSLAINNDYFERYRTTAYGISMSGSTFGVLYLSPLVSWLLSEYDDFRLVYLALAAVFSINLLLVMFIKPRSATLSECPAVDSRAEVAGKGSLEAPPPPPPPSGRGQLSRVSSRLGTHFERQNSVASISLGARSRRQSVLSRGAGSLSGRSSCKRGASWRSRTTISEHQLAKALAKTNLDGELTTSTRVEELSSGPHSVLDANRIWNQSQPIDNTDSAAEVHGESAAEPHDRAEPSGLSRDSLRLDSEARRKKSSVVFRPKLCVDLEDQQQQQQQRWRRPEASATLASGADESAKQTGSQSKRAKQGQAPSEELFSLELVGKLLRLPYLHCAWIMLALYYLIARVFIIILVDFADDHGFSLVDSTALLNYWSLGELCGRVLLGSLIDLQWLSCKNCISLTCATLAASIGAMVLIESYYIYATCSLLIAALISLEYMLINVMMVEYLGKHHVTSCYSLAAFISSLVLFARPSMIGFFRDQLGSYDGLLLLLAAIAVAFACLFQLLEPLFVRRWPKCQL